jgi:hypothetical protein
MRAGGRRLAPWRWQSRCWSSCWLRAVAVTGGLVCLLMLTAVPSRRGWAPVLAVVVITITAALSLFLLVSTEYGAPIFQPLLRLTLWGILASLPPAGGSPRGSAALPSWKET